MENGYKTRLQVIEDLRNSNPTRFEELTDRANYYIKQEVATTDQYGTKEPVMALYCKVTETTSWGTTKTDLCCIYNIGTTSSKELEKHIEDCCSLR